MFGVTILISLLYHKYSRSYILHMVHYFGVWIRNITTSIDSQNSFCLQNPNKIRIYNKAIKSYPLRNHEIKKVVEIIQLEYPMNEIVGYANSYNEYNWGNSETNKEERQREAVKEYLVPTSIRTIILRRTHSIPYNKIYVSEKVKKQSYQNLLKYKFAFCRKIMLVSHGRMNSKASRYRSKKKVRKITHGKYFLGQD